MKITFKKFDRNFREFYDVRGNYFIRSESDLQEIIYELYDTDNFEINYEEKIIEL